MRTARILVPFALGYVLSYLFRVVNAVIAPDLLADIGFDASQLGLLTGAYFLAFAAFQIPLGILLDRLGPRRTEAALLLFAAAGAFVFASASGLASLIAGRALIGFGVSACLMAAFKGFVMGFERHRLPLFNGIQMAAGGLGAVAGTVPVEVLLGLIGWRGLFVGLGIAALAVSGIIFALVPEWPRAETDRDEQPGGLGTVLGDAGFWRIAPLGAASQAAFLTLQGLWAGPWLRKVAGLGREDAALVLLLVALAMMAGSVLLGLIAARPPHRGIRPAGVAVGGMVVFMFVQAAIILWPAAAVMPLWILFGFSGTASVVCYALLSQSFPAHLAGRVNTAFNILLLAGAFLGQWAFGAVVDLWPEGRMEGYRTAFAAILAIQAAGLAWYFLFPAREKTGPPVE